MISASEWFSLSGHLSAPFLLPAGSELVRTLVAPRITSGHACEDSADACAGIHAEFLPPFAQAAQLRVTGIPVAVPAFSGNRPGIGSPSSRRLVRERRRPRLTEPPGPVAVSLGQAPALVVAS